MLATFGGGSANGFRTSSSSDSKLFDDYGVFGKVFPASPNTNTDATMTEIFTFVGSNLSTNYQIVRAQLLDGTASGYDPLNARLVTSRSSNNSVQPTFMFPASGYNWSTVSSTSHIQQLAAQTASGSSGAGAFSIGGALYTDTTSSKVISRAIHYALMSESEYGAQSQYYLKDVANGGYTNVQFDMPSTSNYHNRGQSTRYNRGHQSTERMLMNISKDQSGDLENVTGMPNVIQANVFDSNFSLINPQSTQSAVARTSYDLSGANTHGNHNRGAYLGGRQVGNVHESFYVGIYYDHSGTSANRGMRFVKFSHNLSTNNVTKQVGDHINIPQINASGGQISYSNQVYPHAYFSMNNHGSAYSRSALNGQYHFYVDLSQTWGNTHNSLAYTFAGSQNHDTVARVGTNVNGNPVYFINMSNDHYLYEYKPASNSWNWNYASATNNTSPVAGINGCFPIPQTNRMIVSTQAGFTLYEIDIP